MIFDFDDLQPGNDRLDLLTALHDANPRFRCTAFAVPGRGNDDYWGSLPEWIELAMHGWLHPDPYECLRWTADRMREAIASRPVSFVCGWKSPGWQTSRGVYEAVRDAGWWIADQHLADGVRPRGMRVYFHEDDPVNRWHGHIGWNGSGNDLAENFDAVLERVTAAESFELVSDAVTAW